MKKLFKYVIYLIKRCIDIQNLKMRMINFRIKLKVLKYIIVFK